MLEKKLGPESSAGWVFPAKSKSGHLQEPRVKGANWSIHSLRRTYATVAESLDVSPCAIKLLVNHALSENADVTAGYINPGFERPRDPQQRITDALKRLCRPEDGDGNKVVALSEKVAERGRQ